MKAAITDPGIFKFFNYWLRANNPEKCAIDMMKLNKMNADLLMKLINDEKMNY